MWPFRKNTPNVVRAKEFILVDNDGKERAALRIDPQKNTVLFFRTPTGEVRMFAGLTQDGTPRMMLLYAGGKGSIELEANDKLNSAALIVTGPTGKAKVAAGIAANGLPAIALFDQNGNVVFPSSAISPHPDTESGPQGFDWDSLLKMP